jgi:hypothetical protein
MPQFRARSAGLQPGISPNADLRSALHQPLLPKLRHYPDGLDLVCFARQPRGAGPARRHQPLTCPTRDRERG